MSGYETYVPTLLLSPDRSYIGTTGPNSYHSCNFCHSCHPLPLLSSAAQPFITVCHARRTYRTDAMPVGLTGPRFLVFVFECCQYAVAWASSTSYPSFLLCDAVTWISRILIEFVLNNSCELTNTLLSFYDGTRVLSCAESNSIRMREFEDMNNHVMFFLTCTFSQSFKDTSPDEYVRMIVYITCRGTKPMFQHFS
jgi:hypothetical protein